VRLNRRVAMNVAFFAVMFAVMLGWAVRQVVSVEQLDKPYPIAAEFPNAFGVLPNAEVTYLGVGYGAVESVDRIPGGVRIAMKIERGRRIPEGATALITRKSAIGEPYIDFAPPAQLTGEFLEAGALVPRDRTQVPLEFSELLRSASAVVSSIPPEDVSTLVHELATGLDGRSEALRDLAVAGDDLAATFAAKTETLDRLAVNNTRLTSVMTEHRDDLASAVVSLRQLSETLKASRGDTSLLLDRGSALLTETADLVAAEKANLDCDLKILEQLIDETTTPRRLAELRAVLEIGPRAYAGLYDAIDIEPDGPWIRVGNISNDVNPPAQYVPPKTLPPVQAIAACASELRAVTSVGSGDYRPRSGTGGPTTALPATGATGAAAGGAAVLGLWLLGRRARRLRSAA
jgi:phospholipid/cholesterol/gamma-HCH transport system substrate-binding protein